MFFLFNQAMQALNKIYYQQNKQREVTVSQSNQFQISDNNNNKQPNWPKGNKDAAKRKIKRNKTKQVGNSQRKAPMTLGYPAGNSKYLIDLILLVYSYGRSKGTNIFTLLKLQNALHKANVPFYHAYAMSVAYQIGIYLKKTC